jgi:hypothetical protein
MKKESSTNKSMGLNSNVINMFGFQVIEDLIDLKDKDIKDTIFKNKEEIVKFEKNVSMVLDNIFRYVDEVSETLTESQVIHKVNVSVNLLEFNSKRTKTDDKSIENEVISEQDLFLSEFINNSFNKIEYFKTV